MTIEKLISEIKEKDYEHIKPLTIKVVLGLDSINKNNRFDKYSKKSEIDIYKSFGEVAFLFEDWTFNSSEFFVLNVLLGGLDNATEFLYRIREVDEGYKKFIQYLYYKKGIVLVNRKTKYNQFAAMTKNYHVSDVLIIGKEPVCKTIYLSLKESGTHAGQIVHCSPKTMNSEKDYYMTWFRRDDKAIKELANLGKTSFELFNIIK